ncbi:hypothetical protein [Mesorhizobium sp.]|uniref:hypothetical protein n=1 Tax=Mesorhizobium sp. TaxID=1871066 RepID=UPI000FEA6E56|nr:hypothetical protein [Mesorhizobium sp.]RWP81569.1 MAG: hypothetical protein EOR10_06050 [Mesorhizobium sp.]
MFVEAIEIAKHFTWPLVISYRTLGGPCFCAIGTFVVVNKDGWFVTAAHNVRMLEEFTREAERNIARAADVVAISSNSGLNREEKRQKIRELPQVTEKSKDLCAPLSGLPGVNGKDIQYSKTIRSITGVDILDLAIGRLEPFESSWVDSYPIFKDPTQNFKPGTSLCKLGYPFNKLPVIFSAETGGLIFEQGTFRSQDFQSTAFLRACTDMKC